MNFKFQISKNVLFINIYFSDLKIHAPTVKDKFYVNEKF